MRRRELRRIRRVLPAAAAAWAVLMLPSSLSSARAGEGTCPVQPVFAENFPDPYVLRVDETYYAYSTNSKGTRIPVLRSTNLSTWEEAGDALPELPAWAAQGRRLNWAPAVVRVGERYILYYTTRYKEKGRQAISRATADSPLGPFVDNSDGPVVFQEELGGSIDPEVFRDDDGSLYLLWKSDANAVGLPSTLYAQRLASDGLTLQNDPVPLVSVDQEWEQPLIENPSMLRHDGRFYLIYSANWWQGPNYAVAYAAGPSPLGPFEKQEGGPILRSHGARERGPGGASFFRDASGAPWIAYHAWSAPLDQYGAGGSRSLHLARVKFDEGRLRFHRWSGGAECRSENHSDPETNG